MVLFYLINIFITAAFYLFIPVIFILIGKPISKKMRIFICVMSFCIGFIFLSLIKFYLSGGTQLASGGGSLFWTLLGYWLMKKKIDKPTEPKIISKNNEKLEATIGYLIIIGILLLLIVVPAISYLIYKLS